MMKKYLIAGLRLGFDYQYSDYFKGNIEKYEIDDNEEVDFSIFCKTVDIIDFEIGELVLEYKNRSVYKSNDYKSLVVYDQDFKIKLLMRHSNDYREYEIYMTSKLKDSLAEMEYVYSGMAFMEIAIKHKRLALHASAIKVNERAVLFSGSSGVGKTTHVNNWKKVGIDLEVINDDKPLIYKKNELYFVAGTPWSGKEVLNSNEDVRLHAIVFLEPGPRNEVKSLSNSEKLKEMLKNCHRPSEEETYDNVLSIIEEVIKETIMIKFVATKDSESALVLHKILF